MERKLFVDSSRGLGIFLVLVAHSCGIPLIGGGIFASYMPLFFVLSGYIYKDKPKFMLGKAKRLLIPYFAYSTVLYVVFLLFRINGV